MNKIRLIFILTSLFVAGNALAAVGNLIDVINKDCVIRSGPPNVTMASGTPDNLKVTVAKRGRLIKAHCLIKTGENPGIDSAEVFNNDNAPACSIFVDAGVGLEAYFGTEFHGTITPSGNFKLHCTCDLDNGCFPSDV